MNKVKIDLLREKYGLEDEQRSPFLFFGRLVLVLVIISALTGAVFSYRVNSTSNNTQFPDLSLFSTIKHLVGGGTEKDLAGEEDDRINVLLMGIGGGNHSGPQLTDTMIFASYKPSTGDVGMISIPRDLNVPIEGHGWRKINHANAFGEMQEPGSGPQLATNVVETVLDQDIHYYARIDFDGFATFIDQLGGIDVYVDRSFTDYQYPSHGQEYANCGTRTTLNEEGEAIETPEYGCRYETLSFEEGMTHMDGDTALKYVRSRHGTNGESSDFARSRRQQNVLMAVKDKLFSASTLLNISKLGQLRDTLEDNIATNFETWELLKLAKQAKDQDITREGLITHVLDSSPASPLYATTVNGAYVLLPKNDDWRPIQRLADQIFEQNALSHSVQSGAPSDEPRILNVEIQNGTDITGLAARTSQLLDGQGFDVVQIGNAQQRGYTQTVIYDFTDGQATDALQVLRDYLRADVSVPASSWLANDDVVPDEVSLNDEKNTSLATVQDIDFLVILGEDAAPIVTQN